MLLLLNSFLYAEDKSISRRKIIDQIIKSSFVIHQAGKADRLNIQDRRAYARKLLTDVEISEIADEMLPDQIVVSNKYEILTLQSLFRLRIPYNDEILARNIITKQLLILKCVSRYLTETPPITKTDQNSVIDSLLPVINSIRSVIEHEYENIISKKKINTAINRLLKFINQYSYNRLREDFKKPIDKETSAQIIKDFKSRIARSKQYIIKMINEINQSDEKTDNAGNNSVTPRHKNIDAILQVMLSKSIKQLSKSTSRSQDVHDFDYDKYLPDFRERITELEKKINSRLDQLRPPMEKKMDDQNTIPDTENETNKTNNKKLDSDYQKALQKLGIKHKLHTSPTTKSVKKTNQHSGKVRRQDPRQPSGFNYAN